MSLHPAHWYPLVDRHAATVAIWHTERILQGLATAQQLGESVAEHFAPMLPEVRRSSRLTAAAALGGPAASLAGAFARVHRGVAAHDRPAVTKATETALLALQREAGRRLVQVQPDEDEPGLL